MKTKTARLLLLLVTVSCFASFPPVQAQPADAQFSQHAPVSTVTNDTIAAGEIDLLKIDLPAFLDMFGMTNAEPAREAIENTASSLLQRLDDAGASKIYLTVPSRALMRGGICLVVPCDDAESVSKLLSDVIGMVPSEFDYTVITRDADVILCPALISDLFKKQTGEQEATSRPEIDEAFASVARFPHRAVFGLPNDLQKEIAAVWPAEMTIAPGVKISPKRILNGLTAIACGWSLPPESSLELRFICVDDEAAVNLNDELASLFALVPPSVPRPDLRFEASTVVATLSDNDIQALLAGAIEPQRRLAEGMATLNSVKQLALALHNFIDIYQFIPGKYTADANGKPLLSWRVTLLPFLEQKQLYEKFKRDEPWDSPHNRSLLSEMPELFKMRGDALPDGHTRMRLPVIEGSAWDGEGPPKEFKDITDGTSNTLWVAVAPKSAAVPWTKPDDWELDADDLIEDFFGNSETTVAGRFDGSVQTLSREIDPEVLQALLTIAGGEVIDNAQIK